MNYNIIKDEKLLREFIDWLPDLKPTEQYYLALLARNKYCKEITHIKSDKAQLKRFTSTKDRMFDKIRQLECPIGSYKQYKEGKQEVIDIPQEALALYVTPNPRSLWKATSGGVAKLLTCITSNNTLVNPHAEIMSEIQKSKGKTRFVLFDVDFTDSSREQEVISIVFESVNKEAVNILRTRGGIHLIIEPQKILFEYKNTWYNNISTIPDIDQKNDMMIPVPGCTQGNFIPHFIKN